MVPLPPSKHQAFDAALQDATAAHQGGRFVEAAAGYEALLPSAPNDAQLRYLLGAAYLELGRFSDAVAALEHSLRLRSRHLPTLEMLGSVWVRQQAPEKSIPYFREAVELSGGTAATTSRLANALRLAHQYSEASEVYRRLLTHVPSDRHAQVGLSICLSALGDVAGAEHLLRTCVGNNPDYSVAYVTLASVLGGAGRFIEAEHMIKGFLAGSPTHVEARRLLGNIVHKQGRLAEAEEIYRQVLREAPADVQTALQLAETLVDRTQLDDAEDILRDLHRIAPDHANIITTLGRVLELRGDLEAAIALHSEAIDRDPRCENAYLNRGSAKRFSGDLDAALADYDSALSLKPNFPSAIANRGLTLLTLGRLDEAWPSYRSRIRALAGAPDLSAGKPWDGSPLTGKRVLVWLEYGLGDEIFFASLLPELTALAAHCTVVCAPRLCTLFQRSFPRARIIPMGSVIEGDFDVRLPLTDVAQWLRPTFDTIRPHAGYIVPDAALVEEMRARYAEGGGRLIGLSWRSASGPTGRFKSMELSQWAELLSLPGATFVSLQYGDCADEIARASQASGRAIIQDSRVDTAGDLDVFAAQVAAMDLVISVSNTTVHVAGALGKPVWALIPKGPGAHWYWFLNRSDSPWYPSVKLFRQEQRSDWDRPLHDVARELGEWLQP